MYSRIYVHVPFCVKKCHYCAFVSSPPKKNDLPEYPDLLLRELLISTKSSKPLASIYFGGGTPSLLKPDQIARILDKIAIRTSIQTDAEITLEANPGTVDRASLQAFFDAGINRISVGIQSFDDHFLKLLGRIHTNQQSHQAVQDARRAGFNNISIDLIHSLPGQGLDQWRNEILQAITLSPEHISVYGLTIEDNTSFSHIYHSGSPLLPNEDLSADMFELAHELLTAAGFEHYEIANYARAGYRSRHNSGYWNRDGYLGLGVAAHSFLREQYGVRFSNPATAEEYRHSVISGQLTRVEELRLTERDAMAEYMFLGLRLVEGISQNAFKLKFGRSVESVYGSTVSELTRLGLLIQNDEMFSLTVRGMLLSNQVFTKFL